jgi:hypothetical protein
MICGDILLARYPFTDGSASKLRPVLVVSSDQYNVGDDLVVSQGANPMDATLRLPTEGLVAFPCREAVEGSPDWACAAGLVREERA